VSGSNLTLSAAAITNPVAVPAAVVTAAEAAPGVIGLPRINEPAPHFRAQTTFGPRSLADHRGQWLVLFSHPAGFTPVCSTESPTFARAAEDLRAPNCELLGSSIDSICSRLACMQNIKHKSGVDLSFPIIEDRSLNVARAYGMIHPGASDTAAVRATFVIDNQGFLGAMVYHPMTYGCSVAEILRLLRGLQRCFAHGGATPEGWEPVGKCLVGAPKAVAELEARMQAGLETADWYVSKKPAA
jgi:peroxiredoxin 2/4